MSKYFKINEKRAKIRKKKKLNIFDRNYYGTFVLSALTISAFNQIKNGEIEFIEIRCNEMRRTLTRNDFLVFSFTIKKDSFCINCGFITNWCHPIQRFTSLYICLKVFTCLSFTVDLETKKNLHTFK